MFPPHARTFPALGILMLVAGCATEDPYVATDYRYHQLGTVEICYNDETATAEQVKRLADEECQKYSRMAVLEYQQKHQCSWTAPTLAYFNCLPRPGEHPPPLRRKNSPLRHDDRLPIE